MRNLRRFETVAELNAAIANSTIGLVGLAFDEHGKPVVKTKEAAPPTPSYDYVEIGGLKWATKNIGAETIYDYGLYFQWGDTIGYTADQVGNDEGQKAFTWADYKFNPSGDGETFTKYNSTDGKTELDLEDDAAHVIMGGDWRMPTKADWDSLFDNTTNEWIYDYNGSGVNGVLFTDNNDSSKKLFFPASAYCGFGSVYSVGNYGHVWSCTLSIDYVNTAWYLTSSGDDVCVNYDDARCLGLVVRGVAAGEQI